MCAPCPVATSPGGTRRGRGGAHGRPAALPRTPRVASDGTAGLLASGSSYSRAFPRGQPPSGGIHRAQWHISGFVPGYSGGGGPPGPPPPPPPAAAPPPPPRPRPPPPPRLSP